jgi:DNA-binding PadR family transcriptional regulator
MADFDQCPCAGTNLDKFLQPLILLFLAEQAMHGYALIQKMTSSPMLRGERPDPTGVYRFLKAMEDRGLVMAFWELAESGPPKKTYRITDDGRACLAQWIDTLRDYATSIEALVQAGDRVLTGSAPELAVSTDPLEAAAKPC